jgi:uncharacterized membrane protein
MTMQSHKPGILGIIVLMLWIGFGIGPKHEEIYVIVLFSVLFTISGLISAVIWPKTRYLVKAYPLLWVLGFSGWYLRFIVTYQYPPAHYQLLGIAAAIALALSVIVFVASYFSGVFHDRFQKSQ